MQQKRMGSRSDMQAEVEAVVLTELSRRFNLELIGGRVKTGHSFVELDGLALDAERHTAVIVEVFAHVGRVKPAQRHKVHADVFKLALVRSLLLDQGFEDVRAIFVFVCEECARSLTGKTWVGDAAQRFGVTSLQVAMPDGIVANLLEAQSKQNLMES